MVRRETFINKIRDLGYTYKGQQKRTYLWRKVGGSHRMSIPMAELLEDEYVRSSLRQAGVAEEDINHFVSLHSAAN